MRRAAATVLLWLVAATAGAQNPAEGVAFEQRIGVMLPMSAKFRDDSGAEATLERWIDGKPAVLALVFFRCPMLCTQVLQGLARALGPVGLSAGGDFQVLAVSFDARETPAQAEEVRRRFGTGWRFLTGDAEAIRRLCEAVGFRYRYDARTDQFAHASGVVVATPEGVLARYFFGIEYSPRDLRLALVESADGTLGDLADRLLLLCYHYDPRASRYGLHVLALVRMAGIVTALALAGFVVGSLRREWRKRRA